MSHQYDPVGIETTTTPWSAVAFSQLHYGQNVSLFIDSLNVQNTPLNLLPEAQRNADGTMTELPARVEQAEFTDGSGTTGTLTLLVLTDTASGTTIRLKDDYLSLTPEKFDALAGDRTKLKAMQDYLGTLSSEERMALQAENDSHWAIAA